MLFVPICFVISFLIPLLCYFVYGLNDTLVNVPRYHVTTLSSCHIVCGCSLKCRRRATLFAFEDLKTYHVVKLFCGRRFATLFALCVSTGGVVLSYFAVEDFAVVGVSIDDRPPGSLTFLS